MDQEQVIKELQQEIETLKSELANIKNFTTNLGGSLEFKTLIQTYANEDINPSAIKTFPNLSVTSTFGVFGVSPVGQQSHVADPAGGGTVDSEARSAINSILTTLETFGFHATS